MLANLARPAEAARSAVEELKTLERAEGSARALDEAIERLDLQHEELSVTADEIQAQLEQIESEARRADVASARYQVIFEHSPDALLVTDDDGTIREANLTAAKLFGIEPRFLHGKPLVVFVGGPRVRQLRELLLSFRQGHPGPVDESAIELDVLVLHRRGRRSMATLRAVRSPEPGRILWSIRAPLESMRGSVAAPMNEQEVDQLVRKRTREIERSLEEVSSLLDVERSRAAGLSVSNAAKERSMTVVSHELRAPMQAILGWVGLLREGVDAETTVRALGIIERNARRQADMVANLFEQSRLTGKRPLSLAPVDLAPIVAFGIESMEPRAGSAGVTLVPRITAEAWIVGDEPGLQRLLDNLLANAIRHTPSGGRVFVTLEASEAAVVLSVRDEGEGIARESLARLFEPFEERTYATGGLGLGLSLVRALASRLGGSVSATSEGPGKGACFVVTLPRLRDA